MSNSNITEGLDNIILSLTEALQEQVEFVNYLAEAKLFKEATD